MAKARVSAYEQERLDNIRQNQELLESLSLVGDHAVTLGPPAVRKIGSAKRVRRVQDDDGDGGWGGVGGRRGAALEPARRSKRLRGESAEAVTRAEEQVVETGDASGVLAAAEDHFPADVVAKAVRVSGHYSGWVEPELMARLGLKGNAAEAWESQGGGKFSFADPLGTGKRLAKRAVPSGQSVAKYVASKLLKKNPNAYFYRHTEPGTEQWTGDWTEEETQVFLRLAREHGCGDKWGLFSTFIPHRVGYQCSNFYRQYVIPQGWVIDDNYRIDSTGHAVYVGKHRRSH
ncbi:hypothetical protein H4R19_002925 [Coemansia spiralis]|nr:hypothetical protein H4R19_002925 [Coemansia spiralis]